MKVLQAPNGPCMPLTRNSQALRLFLVLNILVLLYGLNRLRSTGHDTVASSSRTVVNHLSHRQPLAALEDLAPCDCQEHERTISELRNQITSLNSQLTRLDAVQRSSKPEPVACKVNTSSTVDRRVSASRVGDDVNSSSEFQVPNIVHFIWYNEESRPLEFHHMLSILSADKFIQPDVIYFHTNNPPVGKYWEQVRTLKRLRVNMREPPLTAFGERIKTPLYYTSHSNVDRVLVLMEYGGIYMDFDFIAVSSFDALRRHVCTVGLESDEKVCGSVIVCSKDAFFLRLWMNAYFDDYRMDEWAYNTGQVPFNLAKRFPSFVNVEKTRLNRPNFLELSEIYVKATWWKWRENFGFHSWYRLWKSNYGGQYSGVEPNETNVRSLDSPFGEIARAILYDEQ